MDPQVIAALSRWPNVPHCYGWLALDPRGHWRMRDERTQQQGLAGDIIRHEALIGFIHRNYTSDATGGWFFQNGPQRVYVELAYTPWVIRLEPSGQNQLEGPDWRCRCTSGPLFQPQACYLDESGNVLLAGHVNEAQLQSPGSPFAIGLLHDHDLDAFSAQADLCLEPAETGTLGYWHWQGHPIAIERILRADVPSRFGFIASPQQQARYTPCTGEREDTQVMPPHA